ncbi:uncharacterized protein LOC116779252 [Danaus plexippus]|uniref:uncharacterized protein LOC116779252 n=1 Tax=Danaus plexippus TaxID=13037 RepID=UPI002AB2F596|nr:uncharacterized protein LOC116779252 [Danaus plexippus]
MKEILYLVLISIIFHSSNEVVLSRVPTHLLDCYQGGGPILGAPRRLDVFLSLLRKLELNSRLDMRLLSSALLRSLRLDGIEQSANSVETDLYLPYGASAFQFHRYKLLMEIFLPSQDLLNVNETLSTVEKCTLHKMLSSTVQRWERGDENVVCPLSAERKHMEQSANRINSRCPIEDGVIKTDWGTISPGILVAALASSLEAQRVDITDILGADIFKDEVSQSLVESAKEDWYDELEQFDVKSKSLNTNTDISNVWVATLAGDLAEVVINQGARVGASAQKLMVGSSNRWNDTFIPRIYYLFPQNATLPDWHFTDAEILAGIDGLIIANYLPKWVEQRRSLRLSQIIEMYYSNEGVSFDTSVRACNRQALFANIVNGSQLFTETSRFAHMLSLQQITVYIPKEEMERITTTAVGVFMNYVPNLLRRSHQECKWRPVVANVDLIVATDGSWKGYEVEQFMSWISEAIEVGAQGSSISLVNGNTGEWIVRATNLTDFFVMLTNESIQWPNRLNLPNVISTIIEYSRDQTLQEISDMVSAGRSTVVLVVTSERPSNDELERSRSLMQSLRQSFYDVYFAYAATDMTEYQNINNQFMDYSELFLKIESNSVIDVIRTVDIHLVKNIIPFRIIGPQCPVNGTNYFQTPYENYVLPYREQFYRIHPFYLRQQSLINIQFRNDGQGQILVCLWRGAEVSRSCQMIKERDVYTFNLTDPCPSREFCPPAHLSVKAVTTLNSCANSDCRLPHQVGYYFQHSGFRCLPLLGAAAYVKPFLKVQIILSLMISFLYYRY